MKIESNLFGILMMAALMVVGAAGVVVAGDGDDDKATLTGCLVETDEGDYVLQQQDSDDEVVLRGEDLGDHADHTVTVEGKWSEAEDGGRYFAVESLEHLSASCES